MSRSQGGIAQAVNGFGLLKALVLLAVLGLVIGVGYLLLGERAKTTNLAGFRSEGGGDAGALEPNKIDPVLTAAQLQQVLPPERIESPPDSHDPAPQPPTPSPLQQPAHQTSLPGLDNSDAEFRHALLGLDATTLMADLLIDEELIRKFVVVVDNMAEGRIPRKHSLLKLPQAKFKAHEAEGGIWLDSLNFGRYDPYVSLLTSLDVERSVQLYQRYYPLMQQAYAELGYPRRSFHQRFLQALDLLLDSPVMPRPLPLEQPSVMYKYADPELERLADVHKQMLRLGSAHAVKILDRITLFRTALGKI